MDLSETIVAKSDQQNADDYTGGPKTVTISKVVVTKTDQPVSIHLNEFPGRPYKPSKSMRRVLVAVWGKDSDNYVGKSLTLYRDPKVKYAGEAVGGLKISHMSDLSEAATIMLTETRGNKKPHRVQPLQQASAPQPQMLTKDTWDQISTAATQQGIENPGAWASEQLGRKLNGPQEITAEEGARLLQTLTTGEAS